MNSPVTVCIATNPVYHKAVLIKPRMADWGVDCNSWVKSEIKVDFIISVSG